MKYGNLTLGQIESLVNKLGGMEVAEAILRGEKTVSLEEAIRFFFDQHGRRISPQGMKAEVVDANCDYRLVQPEVNFADRLARLPRFLTDGKTPISAEEFKQRTRSSSADYARQAFGQALPRGVPADRPAADRAQ